MHVRLLPALFTAVVLIGEALMMLSAPRPASSQPPLPGKSAVPAPLRTAPTTGPSAESVTVTSETVTARLIRSPMDARVRMSRSTARVAPSPVQKRSVFARVLLGNGDSRPQPFPRPGS